MNTIDIELIVVSKNRQRLEFGEGELRELAESIEERQLLQAPILRQIGTAFHLVAGERRLRAIRDIYDLGGSFLHNNTPVPKGHVPYITLGELSPLEAMEAEWDENSKRVDLTWQEQATATAKLMELRTLKAKVSGSPLPSVADIAREVKKIDSSVPAGEMGIAHTDVRNQIILSKHLDDPDVASAKTSKEAFKILQRKEQTARNEALGVAIGRTFTSASHKVWNGKAEDWLEGCMPDTFDVILTDPPYGMGADEFGDSGGMLVQGEHGYKDDADTVTSIINWFPAEAYRIAKPEAHAYIFLDIDWWVSWRVAMRDAGWDVFRTPLIWYKPSSFRTPWPDRGPQRKYELFLYATKGGRKVNKLLPDVLTYQPDTNLGHAAQKPVDLFVDILARSVRPGDTVLDPFCGTGPIFPAAHKLKCAAIGIELDTGAYAIAAKRIEGLK